MKLTSILAVALAGSAAAAYYDKPVFKQMHVRQALPSGGATMPYGTNGTGGGVAGRTGGMTSRSPTMTTAPGGVGGGVGGAGGNPTGSATTSTRSGAATGLNVPAGFAAGAVVLGALVL